MALKLKWRVDPVPTGRYRSFEKRGWPSAEYENQDAAVALYCKNEYCPADVKTGDHAPITIRVAQWRPKEERAKKGAFTWRQFKKQAKTLKEAKELAKAFLEAHPEFHPNQIEEQTK